MNRFLPFGLCVVLSAVAPGATPLLAQAVRPPAEMLSLQDLSAFTSPPSNWRVVGSAVADRHQPNSLTTTPGSGVLVNNPTPEQREDLFTTWEHGDLDLSLDYMMPKGSNSGIYFQGRYELQLFDSWGVRRPGVHDNGAVHEREDDSRPEGQQGYGGTPPRLNASRAPGLWQHLEVIFRAPRFDAQGRKTANARFVRVVLNGAVIHENVEVTGPTPGSVSPDEKPTGPLRIQGRLGPVAIRNVSFRRYNADSVRSAEREGRERRPGPGAITVEPNGEPVVQRSFIRHGETKRTHAVSVGDPVGVHYSYDLSEGAMLQAWRGPFLETTDMWHERGEPQTAEALGSVLMLAGTPALAHLDNMQAPWPDSLNADSGYRLEGYALDAAGRPTFLYALGAAEVEDRIRPTPDSTSLRREIHIRAPQGATGLYVRIAEGKDIRRLADGSYAVDDFRYYVAPESGPAPVVRQQGAEQEILLPVQIRGGEATVSYDIIW